MAKLLDEYAPIAQWDVSTRQTNEEFIRRTLKPSIGHLKIRQVNGEILDKLYARLMRCRDVSCTGHPFTEHRHMPVLNVYPADTRPAWKQVAAALTEAITSGVLLPGDEREAADIPTIAPTVATPVSLSMSLRRTFCQFVS